MARTLEIRRHTFTKKGPARGEGTTISQEGVDLARRVGAGLGPFHLVVVSDIPRTLETALAMGFAVDETDADLSAHDDALHRQVAELGAGKRLPFATWARLVSRPGPIGEHARRQRQRWLALASPTPEGASTLVISHGGTIEAGIVASLPSALWVDWGPLLPCDGVRVEVEGGEFVRGTLLRA
ncbi:MAG TPA: histidine phosphatase family protein [Polyangiaceae bacterium]|nr:histidine phosphatase family protein [Polyangiaceae bacterium]